MSVHSLILTTLSLCRLLDVNEDPVILIDGLTKNFRLPGWRVCWVMGPKNLISALSQSGTSLLLFIHQHIC